MTSRRSLSTLACGLVALGIVLASCGGDDDSTSSSSGSDDLTLRLNWTPYAADHAFYYAGLEAGIYEEHGIDLTIEPGNGSATVLKLVDNGSDPVALVDAATMLKGKTSGMEVVMVAAITQTNPMAFVFPEGQPLETAEDLEGATIALTQGDSLSQVLPAVLASAGLEPDAVTTVSAPSPGAKETAVLQGEADALLGYFTEQPLRMEATTGEPMGWTPFSDFGVNTFNMGIVVNESWLHDNSDLAGRFMAATQDAIAATIDDPATAADAFVKHNADFDKDLAVQEIEATIPLLHTEASQDEPIGWMADSDWQATVDVMTTHAGVPEHPIDDLFTNEFVGGDS